MLHGDVVHDLVVTALQECRVDGSKRLEPLDGEAGGEGDGMLLCNANVEATLRERLFEEIEPRTRGHGRGDGYDLIVFAGFLDQAFSEDFRVARGPGLALVLRAGHNVELVYAVIFVGGVLGGRVALPLLRHTVDQNRPHIRVADVAKYGQK